MHHTHQYLKDTFFPLDPNSGSGDREKIRVTRDEKTNTVTECIHKIRLGDLNIYSPKQKADWRVSVSLEIPSESFSFSLLPFFSLFSFSRLFDFDGFLRGCELKC